VDIKQIVRTAAFAALVVAAIISGGHIILGFGLSAAILRVAPAQAVADSLLVNMLAWSVMMFVLTIMFEVIGHRLEGFFVRHRFSN
jgi:hypothetical protein